MEDGRLRAVGQDEAGRVLAVLAANAGVMGGGGGEGGDLHCVCKGCVCVGGTVMSSSSPSIDVAWSVVGRVGGWIGSVGGSVNARPLIITGWGKVLGWTPSHAPMTANMCSLSVSYSRKGATPPPPVPLAAALERPESGLVLLAMEEEAEEGGDGVLVIVRGRRPYSFLWRCCMRRVGGKKGDESGPM